MPLLQEQQRGTVPLASTSAAREDLADYIAIVDAKSTPFVSQSPKGKDLGNAQFSWLVDNYADVLMGGVPDGTDVTVANASNPVANRTRLSNYAQVFRRDFRVGFVAETQEVAGVTDELANGIAKQLVQIKRDMEGTFMCTNQVQIQDTGPGGNPYLTSSLGNWLTGTNSANIGACASASPFLPNTGAINTTLTADFTEATVQGVLTAIFNKTGTFRDYDCILGTTLKRAFTNLTSSVGTQVVNTNSIAATSVRTFNQELGNDTFRNSIDIFEGDFGRLVLHPSTFIGSKTTPTSTTLTPTPAKGYVIPMDMVEIRYSKLPQVKNLTDNGGGPARLIEAIAGLVCKNPSGFGMFNATA
jgi:hypothetical protein